MVEATCKGSFGDAADYSLYLMGSLKTFRVRRHLPSQLAYVASAKSVAGVC